MRAVGVEEAAAVGAVFLDDLLRCDRALRDGLRRNGVHHRLAAGIDRGLAIGIDVLHLLRLDQLHRVVRLQVLHHSLRDQQQRANDAERAATPTGRLRTMSTQKLPMVCICRRAMPRMNAMASAIPVAAEMKLW